MEASKLKAYIDEQSRRRARFEPGWYQAFYGYENNHFVGVNRVTGSLVTIPQRRHFLQLPEIKKQADSFENLLLTFSPMFVAYPANTQDPKAIEDSVAISSLLRETYNQWYAENIIHQYVHLAIKYPVSYCQISVDEKYDYSLRRKVKKVVPEILDAFDVLYDFRLPFHKNKVIVKVIRKTYDELKACKEYTIPKGGLIVDSGRDIKSSIQNTKYSSSGSKMCMIYECQILEETGLRVKTIDAGGNVLADNFFDNIDFFTIVPFTTSSGEVMQPSFVQNLIPFNRALDISLNRVDEFLMKFARGAYLKREGSDVTFTDESVVVTYDGEKPDVMNMPQLPPAINQYIQDLFALSERYGVNSVALGLTPQGSQLRSAKMMDMVVKSQMNQQKTAIDNLFTSLKRIAEITVYFLSETTTEPITITEKQDGQNYVSRKFIGERFKELDPEATPIPARLSKLVIEIDDSTTFSIDAKRESLMEFATQFQNIPQQFQKILIDLYKVGNTADIMAAIQNGEPLLQNPEMVKLMEAANAGLLPPGVANSLADVFDYLAQNSPVPSLEETGFTNIPGAAESAAATAKANAAPVGRPAGPPPSIAP